MPHRPPGAPPALPAVLGAGCWVLIAFALTASAEVPFPRESEKWLRVEVPGLPIYSNADAARTEAFASHFLKLRAALGKGTGLSIRSPLPTRVLLFRDEKSFAPVRDAILQAPRPNISGLFLGGRDANYILIRADGEEPVRLVYRELTRHLLRNTLPAVPPWLEEGIADFYSTFAAKGEDIYAGALVPEYVNFLRERKLMPLGELLAAQQVDVQPHAWALTHYLMSGSDSRREQVPAFLSLLEAGKPVEEAFRSAFATTVEALDRELQAYVKRLVFGFRRSPAAELQVPAIPGAQPAGRDAVLYAIGDLLAHSATENRADAERFLIEVLRVNPNHAGAHASLGAYEKALQASSSDAEVHVRYGFAVINGDAARARTLFQRAVELDPTSARAHAGLGAAYALSEKERALGIAALEKSLSLGGDQKDAAFYLLQLYARAGRRDEARRLFDTVLARVGDTEMLRRARENLLAGDAVYAEALLERGNVQEASAVLHQVEKAASNERLKKHVAALLVEVDRQVQFKKHADAYDTAVEKASAGKYQEALTIADELLPQITDKDLRGMVQRFRDEVARKVKN